MTDDDLILQQPAQAAQLILLFHGVGANAAGLAPLGHALAEAFPQAMVVAVNAPDASGNPGGRQWFSVVGVTEENRAQRVAQAMPAFLARIAEWQRRSGLDARATALLGFSQGAIMALESSQQQPAPATRIVAIAGRFAALPQRAVYDGSLHFLHGKEDPVISYQHSVLAAQHLITLGADITADVLPFTGHQITPEMAALAVQRLSTHIPQRLWQQAMQAASAGSET